MTRVLTVEADETLATFLASREMSEPDVQVCGQARSAGAALGLLRRTEADVVLLDYALLGTDGLQVLRAIVQAGRLSAGKPPRVLFCGSAEDAIAAAVQAAGAAGWVQRERVAADLVAAIRAVAEGRQWFPSVQAHAAGAVPTVGHVLVAEDDAAMRGLLQDVLPQLGCSVSLAWRGEDVLDRMAHERFDLLILDHQLAGRLTGTEVMLEAARRHPELPVLFMTGLPDEVAAFVGHHNVRGVISKPFRLQALRDEVRRVLQTSQSVPAPG